MDNVEPISLVSRSYDRIVVQQGEWFYGPIKTPLKLDETLLFNENGSASKPLLTFGGAQTSGLFVEPGSNPGEVASIAFSVNGSTELKITPTGIRVGAPISMLDGSDMAISSPTPNITMSGKILTNVIDVRGVNGVSLLGSGGNASSTITLAGVSSAATVPIGSFTFSGERIVALRITVLCGDSTAATHIVMEVSLRRDATNGTVTTRILSNMRDADASLSDVNVSLSVSGQTVTLVGNGINSRILQWQGRMVVTQLFLS